MLRKRRAYFCCFTGLGTCVCVCRHPMVHGHLAIVGLARPDGSQDSAWPEIASKRAPAIEAHVNVAGLGAALASSDARGPNAFAHGRVRAKGGVAGLC